ncbi:MAG: hypothetical protein M0038_13850 [Pseudomonadota bacterium]|nr:hypothetical protein [Pseudomonadota bacterium]
MNLAGRWFREVPNKANRRGSFVNVPDLKQAIDEFMTAATVVCSTALPHLPPQYRSGGDVFDLLADIVIIMEHQRAANCLRSAQCGTRHGCTPLS